MPVEKLLLEERERPRREIPPRDPNEPLAEALRRLKITLRRDCKNNTVDDQGVE